MSATSVALCSQSLMASDLCYAIVLAIKEGDSNRACLLAHGLHGRIRKIETAHEKAAAGEYTLRADHIDWLDVRDPNGERNTVNQPAAMALIRQQTKKLAEQDALADIGRQWNADSSLAKWFPITAKKVEQDAEELAALRTQLAAAVSDREIMAADWLKWMDRAEQAEGRLSAIESESATMRVGTKWPKGL